MPDQITTEPKQLSEEDYREHQRLVALDRLDILDTPREEAFDRLVQLIRDIFGVRIGLVSLMDGHRLWNKAQAGLPGVREFCKKETFCRHAIAQDAPLVIPDATADSRFSNNPSVTGEPYIRFYAGVPLKTRDGHNVGTICAIDDKPRRFSAQDLDILTGLSRVAMDELELRQKAGSDDLTGLLTRRAFRDEGSKALALAVRHQHPLACVVFDLDLFKAINDTYGHAVGDKVLVAVTRACEDRLRQSDIVGRLGGEEFGALLPYTSRKAALGVAEKLRSAIERLRIEVGEATINVTASFGISLLGEEIKDITTLLANADAALYQAKAKGRNRCEILVDAKNEPEKAVRRRVLKSGRIIFNDRKSTMDCTVRSLATDGAGLDVANAAGIPDRFRLVIGSDHFEAPCRVTAQTDRHLEVEFV